LTATDGGEIIYNYYFSKLVTNGENVVEHSFPPPFASARIIHNYTYNISKISFANRW